VFAQGLFKKGTRQTVKPLGGRAAKVINPEAKALQQVSGIWLRVFSRSPAVPRPDVSIVKF
jgi:hypothetical protein